MERLIIRLNSIKKVQEFVNIANQYDKEISIRLGRYVVNGKSILSIFCLELQSNLILEIESGENLPALIQKLETYIVSDSWLFAKVINFWNVWDKSGEIIIFTIQGNKEYLLADIQRHLNSKGDDDLEIKAEQDLVL